MFRLVQSDLFDLPVEAIVNPANRQPELGWGSHVSEQIKARAGDRVQVEREAFGILELGDTVSTSAGTLPFRSILHAAVLDMYDFNPLFLLRLRQRTSDATLRQAMRTSLDLALHLNLRSVGYSLMGSGIGAMPEAKCARIIGENAIAHPVTEKAEILLAIPTDRLFETLRAALPVAWF